MTTMLLCFSWHWSNNCGPFSYDSSFDDESSISL